MLRITRRDFLKYCSIAAGALGLSASTLMKLDKAMAKEAANGGVPVIWLDGAACTGCSTSLLNSRFYTTIDDILLNSLDLDYHKTVMATAGAYVDSGSGSQLYPGANSLAQAAATYSAGRYVLVVEGAIQDGTPANSSQGEFCEVGDLTQTGAHTMLDNVQLLAANALAVLAVGTCASFGGIPAGRGNITGARGVMYRGTTKLASLAGTTPVINIPGCPPHPDWIVGTIAHILSTNVTLPPLTNYYRPVDYGYREYQCNAGPCPWRYNNTPSRTNANSGTDNSTLFPESEYNRRYPLGDSKALGRKKWTVNDAASGEALGCLGILGCKGRKTKADCSRRRWNTDEAEKYGVNWCVGSRGNCHGCTEPTFPDKVGKFYTFV